MAPPEMYDPPDSFDAQDFEQLVQDGIMAVKNGNLSLAKKLLDQAALVNESDSRIWIWLSATTEDLNERRAYLERAVALDPSNATAKRGLLLVTEKLNQARLVREEAPVAPPPQPPPQPPQQPPASYAAEIATTKTYLCPNCGATISYSIQESVLVCQFCGFTRKIDEQVVEESKDLPLDAVLPTTPAHRWVEDQTKVACEQCGVVIILPAGQTADTCPYCGANRFVTPTSQVEMIDPQRIGLFKVDPLNAGDNIKAWMGKGLLSPDNLVAQQGEMRLYPAYYPFWLFEGTLEIPWFCDVNMGAGRLAQWEAHTGSQFEMFKEVLIPGLRRMSPADLAALEPFMIDQLVDFSPDYLAGWVALTYDQPLADASLRAREKIMKKAQGSLRDLVDPNRPKRNFSTGEGKWSGLTYKLALLPVYTGNFFFQGKPYRILINGQTGKVSGKKPVDTLKVVMFVFAGILLLAVILAVLFLLGRAILG